MGINRGRGRLLRSEKVRDTKGVDIGFNERDCCF